MSDNKDYPLSKSQHKKLDIKTLVADIREAIAGTERDIPAINLAFRKSRFNCPVCNAAMHEYMYMERTNLLVDACHKGHGVYLESGELKRALELY